MSRQLLQIGEVARLLGVTPKTVRHYHKLKLVPEPERSEGGYRLYSTAELFQLRRIRRLQALGLSLNQIKSILEADDPDTVLQTTLERLRDDLIAQQTRIEARRHQVEHLLAEEASLAEVEQPQIPSPTYRMFSEKLHNLADIPQAAVDFDQHLFGQLDAFDWGEAFNDSWRMVAEHLAANPEHYELLTHIADRFVAMQTMPEDDPRIAVWAEEFLQSGLMDTLAPSISDMVNLESPLAETMNQIVMQNADQQMSPAQRRFFDLLNDRGGM